MKKTIFALSMFALLLLFAGCGGQQPSGGGTTATHPEPPPTGNSGGTSTVTSSGGTTSEAAGTASAAAITIQNFAFSPSTITIAKGTTVAWTNKDSAPHAIKWEGVESPAMNQGEKFEYKFENAGTYEYSCSIHPSMKGTIVVQ